MDRSSGFAALVKLRMSKHGRSARLVMKEFRPSCSVVTNKRWQNSGGMSRHLAMKDSVQWRCNIEVQPNATGRRKSWRQKSRNWKLNSLDEMQIPKQARLQEFVKDKEIQTRKNLSQWKPHQKRSRTRCVQKASPSTRKEAH